MFELRHSCRSQFLHVAAPFLINALRGPRYCNALRFLGYSFSHSSFTIMTAIAALMLLQRPAVAGPEGGSVVAGQAAISHAGPITNINQSTNKAVINWQGFSVGASETVNFNQPGASSVTLNRVIGNESSVINGALNANGQVFIVNSAGVLFGKGAQVNVGGLVASTLDISNSDFMAGNYKFSGTSSASVVNQGRIRAGDGGYVALLGKTVSNEGVISARLGTVAMSSGEKITLNFEGNSLFDVTIEKGTLNALVQNKRAIRADGGQVIMTAKAADQVLSAQVNNSGIIQARSVAALKGGGQGSVKIGKIKIIADGGTTNVSGKLDASAPKGGDGGFVETSGNKVKIADDAIITTRAANGKSGAWLIDPTDFNIVAGSGAHTSSGIGATTLANNLGLGNVSIVTFAGGTENGDINVNASVSWLADTILTLTAANNININQAVTASGDSAGLTLNAGRDININNAVSLTGANATLAMNYGGYNGTTVTTPMADTNYNVRTKASYSGTVLDANGKPIAKQDTSGVYGSITFANSANTNGLKINGQTYALIHSMADLAGKINVDPNGFYALAQSLNASGTTYGGAVVTNLGGTLAGLGNTISNLRIESSAYGNAALIGKTQAGSVIRDIGMVDVDIAGMGGLNEFGVGALVGWNYANISHAYSTGKVVSLDSSAGGLIGLNGRYDSPTNTISDSFSDVLVTGATSGGLIGRANHVDIYRSHAAGDVTSPGGSIGGLIGYASSVNVYKSYASGAIAGAAGNPNSPNMQFASAIGGLIGIVSGGDGPQTIKESYATGNVTGAFQLGGLVGSISAENYTIENSYATGNVTSYQNVAVTQQAGIGGLVGYATGSVDIKNSHAAGNVSYTGFYGDFAGGLVGNMDGNTGVIDNSYATGNVTGSTGGNRVGGLLGSGATNITNSYASGNVTGNLTVGGLAGANLGTITNSYSTGNVIGANNNIGGLVGTNLGSIVGSHATGSVTGLGANSSTGGVVGSNAGSITNSYASGRVTGPGGLTGGIAGSSFNGATITNSWYNSAINPGLPLTNSLPCCDPGIVNGGGGLNREQMSDIQFYANGTINQVLADRAAVAEAARAESTFHADVARTGSTVASAGADAASRPADTGASDAGTNAASSAKSDALNENAKAIEDEIKKAEDAERERRRKAAVAASDAARGRSGSGAGYGATIRSIDVDGQRFDLEGSGAGKDGGSGSNNNNNGAPAPGGAGQ